MPLLLLAAFSNTFIASYYGTSSASIAGSLAAPTRLQLWTHVSLGVSVAISAAAFVVMMYVFARHAKAWHKVVVKGEEFVVNHHMIDAALVAFALFGIIITRSV